MLAAGGRDLLTQLPMKKSSSLICIAALALLVDACSGVGASGRKGVDPLLSAGTDGSAVDDDVPVGRLPNDVRPLGYDLDLTIDPRKESFQGVVSIAVELTRPRDHLWLHGRGIKVRQAQLSLADGATLPVSYKQMTVDGVARIDFNREIGPQQARLVISYDAPFDDKLAGLYKVVEGGGAYAFTQFEATDARKAFPSFDEPSFKVPFGISITAPAAMTALATTPVASTEENAGMIRYVFERTEKLPTYLIALAVGEFDVVEHAPIPSNDVRPHPVPLRGIAVKGKGAKLAYALENTGPILAALESYFQIPYAYKKIDIVAVPDFEAGAMENVGVITFREWLLLFDEDEASARQLRAYAYVMAHELAHQWFGNLVTMPWWDDLWLNESFATWMGNRAVDLWNPSYESHLSSLERSIEAMQEDSLAAARAIRQPIASNHDIANAFDGITYSKGNGVLAMFEQYLGRDVFQKGVQHHLETFRHGNSTVDDFLTSMETATGHPVSGPFRSFLLQPGVPILSMELSCSDEVHLNIKQARYLPLGSEADGAQTWDVPVCARFEQGGKAKSQCWMVKGEESVVKLNTETCPRWLLPNANGLGYYRYSLSDEQTAALVDAMKAGALDVRERMSFADSLIASFDAGSLAPEALFAALSVLAADSSRYVAVAPMAPLREMIRYWADAGQRERALALARSLYVPRLEKMGLVAKPSDDADVRMFRQRLLEFVLFDARDPGVREAAAKLGRAMIVDGKVVIDGQNADVAGELLAVAAQEYGAPVIDALAEVLKSSMDSTVRRSAGAGLAAVTDPALAPRVRDLALSDSLRTNEVYHFLRRHAAEGENTAPTWNWLRENFEPLQSKVSAYIAGETPWLISSLCDAESADALDEFYATRIGELKGGPRNLRGAMEAIRLCAAKRSAVREAVNGFLKSKASVARR